MTRTGPLSISLVALAFVAQQAAAQTRDHPPTSLESSSKMTKDSPDSESWTYAQPKSVFTKYRTVIVEPTRVYDGPDAQFNGIDPADPPRFAAIITQELQQELAKTFPAPAQPQAD